MKCPVCSYPMTQLFISSVCDRCNPPTAAAEFDTVTTAVNDPFVWGWYLRPPRFDPKFEGFEAGYIYTTRTSVFTNICMRVRGAVTWNKSLPPNVIEYAKADIYTSRAHAIQAYAAAPSFGPVAWPEEQPMSITQVGPPPMPFSSNGRLIP
jgi:hypothetical protein